MTLLETLGVALLTSICALVLRECKSPLAPFVTLGGGVLLLLFLLARVSPLISFGTALAERLPAAFGETVGKVLAAGFLCSIGADICTELGATALAVKLELAGKIEILLLSLPLMSELLSRAEALLV